MKIQFANKNSSTGYIYIASVNRLYYKLAINSCQTLKDYYPDSDVTLFTHEKFLNNECEIFDRVITDIPIHPRTKMWAMARTPYEKTLYNDCDSIIKHKDIKNIHSFLDECDMFFGSNLAYTAMDISWSYIDKNMTIQMPYHGSMCGYSSSEIILQFMDDWYREWNVQMANPWPYEEYDQKWQQFDMFTLWRMTSGLFPEFDKYKDINIKILDRRWNNTCSEIHDDYEGKPVITQISRSTFEQRCNHYWNKIKQEIHDETDTTEKFECSQPPFKYN